MLIQQADIKPILGGVQNNLSLSTLLPFIQIIEMQFKREFSKELYIQLQSEAPESELLKAAKSLILWHALSLSQPHLHLRIGDGGLAKNMPANTVMATKWEYVKLEESNLSIVDIWFEYFYSLLDDLKPEAYTNSIAARVRVKLAVNTAAQFTESFPQMAGSIRMHTKVKPYQLNVEASLKNKITPEVFNAIFNSVTSGVGTVSSSIREDDNPNHTSVADENPQLIHHASMYITHLSVYDALPFINVLISEEGIHIVVKMDGTRNELQAENTQLNTLRKSLYNTAKLHLEHLLEELTLLASPSVFPNFYNKFVKPSQEVTFFQGPSASPII